MACQSARHYDYIKNIQKRRGDQGLPALKCFHNGIILIVIYNPLDGVLDISKIQRNEREI